MTMLSPTYVAAEANTIPIEVTPDHTICTQIIIEHYTPGQTFLFSTKMQPGVEAKSLLDIIQPSTLIIASCRYVTFIQAAVSSDLLEWILF